MPTSFRVILFVAMLGTTLLFGCGTTPRPSADIATQKPHPSPIDNFQIVVPDGIYRSGQPKGDDWAYLKELGVASVIKLNKFSSVADEKNELEMADKYGIKVIRAYLQPEDWPNNWNPWVSPDRKALMQAVKILENRGNEKILVHCAHGRDRTGLVIAAYNVRNRNFCKDTAYKEMEYYGASPFLFGVKPVLYNSENIREKDNCIRE